MFVENYLCTFLPEYNVQYVCTFLLYNIRLDVDRYLIVLLNVLSPHRFAASPSLLSAITPIHARYIQFMKQYIMLKYEYVPKTPLHETRSHPGPRIPDAAHRANLPSLSRQHHSSFCSIVAAASDAPPVEANESSTVGLSAAQSGIGTGSSSCTIPKTKSTKTSSQTGYTRMLCAGRSNSFKRPGAALAGGQESESEPVAQLAEKLSACLQVTPSEFTMCGRRVASFDRLPLADRERLASATHNASIITRLARNGTSAQEDSQLRSWAATGNSKAEATRPKKQTAARQRMSTRTCSSSRGGAEWLFAFCIEGVHIVISLLSSSL